MYIWGGFSTKIKKLNARQKSSELGNQGALMRLEFPRRKLTRTELCGWKNSLVYVLMVAGADPENYSRGGGV